MKKELSLSKHAKTEQPQGMFNIFEKIQSLGFHLSIEMTISLISHLFKTLCIQEYDNS